MSCDHAGGNGDVGTDDDPEWPSTPRRWCWVPEDEEATMKREVGDEVGNMAGGTEMVAKVTRPLKGPRWSGGNPPLCRVPRSTRREVRMAGNLKSPSLHPMNPKLGEGPRIRLYGAVSHEAVEHPRGCYDRRKEAVEMTVQKRRSR